MQNSYMCWNVRVFLGIIIADHYEKMNKYTMIDQIQGNS